MLFRDELKRRRETAGLTQEGFTRAAGMSVANVRNYEQGLRLPSFPAVVKLCAAAGDGLHSVRGLRGRGRRDRDREAGKAAGEEMIGDPEPLTHEERLEFEAEEARLEIEDRRAVKWPRSRGWNCTARRKCWNVSAPKIPAPTSVGDRVAAGTNWTDNGDFTRGFLATLKRVAGQHQLHEF